MKQITLGLILLTGFFQAIAQQKENHYGANLKKYEPANKMIKSPTPGEHRVVLMGNSITEFWVNINPDFFTKNHYIGRGISGQTTPQMLLRFRQDVLDLQPEAVVINAGINDIAENSGPYDEAFTLGNIKSMADLARAHHIKVIFASVHPATAFPWRKEITNVAQKIIDLNAKIKSYAQENGFVYVDYHSAMKNAQNGMNPDMAADGVHPTPAGYKVMEGLLQTAVKATLSQQSVGIFKESLNLGFEQTQQLAGEKIEITSTSETDFFIEPGTPPYEKGNAPLLLTEVDNTKPFTFSFKTTPEHLVKYDAGMAFIYVDAKTWLKFAFEADERMNKRIVTVNTRNLSDDNNHDAVKAASVHMKISSDTKVIGFYYSTDGREWQLVRVLKNDYPEKIKLGIGAQSPVGKGNKAVFEDVRLTGECVKDFRMGM